MGWVWVTTPEDNILLSHIPAPLCSGTFSSPVFLSITCRKPFPLLLSLLLQSIWQGTSQKSVLTTGSNSVPQYSPHHGIFTDLSVWFVVWQYSQHNVTPEKIAMIYGNIWDIWYTFFQTLSRINIFCQVWSWKKTFLSLEKRSNFIYFKGLEIWSNLKSEKCRP